MWAEIAAVVPVWMAGPFDAMDRLFEAGGPVVRWIFLAALVMWTLIVERYWFFNVTLPRRMAEIQREWDARTSRKTWTSRRIRAAMIAELNVAMKQGLALMRVIVPITPLLGLLGTVGGMLQVFDVMALKGAVDARVMAYGVSHAMVCTLTATPRPVSGMFFVARFNQRVKVQTELLADRLQYQ
jgi:biopolymer transport protein ExbB